MTFSIWVIELEVVDDVERILVIVEESSRSMNHGDDDEV